MSFDDECTKCGRHLYAYCEDAIAKKEEHWGWATISDDKTLCMGCMVDHVNSLQARLDLISDEVKDERARHDAVGQGGQKAGDRSPRMNRSMLVELERLIGEEQGKYTYEYFLKMQEEINKLKAANAALQFRIDKMRQANWEEGK